MKIQVRQVRPEGLELKESYPVNFIELTKNDVFKIVSPIEIRAQVMRLDDEVIAKITARSQYESFCFRCLEVLNKEWFTEFTLDYDAKEHHEYIELDEDIRQELILNLPVSILCRVDCKGLCADCGVNLNKKSCKHQHAVTGDKQ